MAFNHKELISEIQDQYLADDIHDAITEHLSKIKDLRITPRASVEQYRETTKPSQIIAKELKVSYLIEGSYSMVNEQVVEVEKGAEVTEKDVGAKPVTPAKPQKLIDIAKRHYRGSLGDQKLQQTNGGFQ